MARWPPVVLACSVVGALAFVDVKVDVKVGPCLGSGCIARERGSGVDL